MRLRKKKRRTLPRIIGYLAASLTVLLGAGFLWLSRDVRSLDFLKPYVQKSISAAFAPYLMEAQQIRYRVDTNDWTLVTGLQGVTLKDAQQHRVAAFSEVNLDLGLLSLLSGSIRFESLEIVKPAIRLTTQKDGGVTLSVSPQDEAQQQGETSAPMEIGGVVLSLKQLAVRTVVVRDGMLGIVSNKATAVYRLPRLMLMTRDKDGLFSIQYDAQVKEEEDISRLTGSVDVDMKNESIVLGAVLTGFNSALLAPFHAYGAYLAGAQARIDGVVNIKTDFHGVPRQVAVDVQVKGGNYRQEELFDEPITVGEMLVKAEMKPGEHVLKIEKASFANSDFSLKASGMVAFTEEGIGADIEAEAKDVKIDRIGAYWPKGMSVDARDWVTTNLSVGTVTEAKAKLKFTPEDLTTEETPEGLLDADLTVKNATVGFLPVYPLVKGVNGDVRITARSLDIVADSGDFMRGTKLTAAHLRIPDFIAPGIPMEFSLTLDAIAPDVAEMIGPKRLDLASALKLNPETISGKAKGTVGFTLPLYSAEWPKDKPYISYDVKAKLDNVSQDGVLSKWNISKMSGDLAVNNEKLEMKTQTQLQEVAAELGIMREFTGKKTTAYTLIADIPRETMPQFGFTIPEQIQGILGIDAKVVETGEQSVTNAKVNLSNTAIDVKELNYHKMLGVPATMTLTQEAKGAQNVVPKFTYDSEGAQVRGSYTQDRKSGDFASVALSKVKLGGNDFALTYKTEAGRKAVSLKGARLDISTPEPKEGQTPPSKEDKNPFDGLLNSRIELEVGKLILSPEHGLSHVKGVIDCGVRLCPFAEIGSETDNGKPFTVTLGESGGKRSFSMASPDGGGVIKAFDISDHVVGGALDFKGDYDDSQTPPVLNGRLILTDFRVVKGPILAKLLSLASLTGFLDTLAGNGIAFTKLSADAKMAGTTLRVKNGKAYGSAIGITVKGKIKPFLGNIDLEGTVVPAYTANSVLGKIPLLGAILTGGEGGGIIAANYSMKGDGEDPSVMVNPLSLLTPGFLRNLFDVFDQPEKEDMEEPTPEKNIQDAPKQEPLLFEMKREFPTIKKR